MNDIQSLWGARWFDGERLHAAGQISWQADTITYASDGRAGAPGAAKRLPDTWTVAPGLIDIQVNGGGGLMFNDAPTLEGVKHIAEAHARLGTTGLLPTLITDSRAQMCAAAHSARQALAEAVPGVLGLHLEGPFLETGRRGIHRSELIAQLTDEDVSALTAIGVPCLITLAPEHVRADQIRRLSDAGLIVFAGHTNAGADVLQRAVREGGLCGVTHLFNAMSQLTPREVGVAGAALLDPSLWAGIILDGHHLSVASASIAWRLRGEERMLLVSDAMAPVGTDQTEFMLQGQRIHVRQGRCEDDAGTLAGAAISLADAVRIGVHHYGLQLSSALHAATAAPARLLGQYGRLGRLQAGAQADLVVLDEQLRVRGVLQRGTWRLPLPEATHV